MSAWERPGALMPSGGAEVLCGELLAADDAPRRAALWLRWLSDLVPGCASALVLLPAGPQTLARVAALPEGLDAQALSAVVTQALELRVLALRAIVGGHELALPLVRGPRLDGVVAITVVGDAASMYQALAAIRWGLGWLLAPAAAGTDAGSALALERARQALDLVAASLNEPALQPAAMALAEQLVRGFGCTLVQFGWQAREGARVLVRSHTAWHDGRAQLVRLAEQAMNEALDQGQPVVWPPAGDAPGSGLVARMAHEAYARAADTRALLTLPLRAQGVVVGALMLERDTPFSADEADSADALAALIGPLLQARHQAEESVAAHLARKTRAALAWALGNRHAGWKLLGGTAALLLLLAALVPLPHRLAAPAVLEGQIQRAAVAPFAGYIRAAAARAGDTVKAGQLLATLDDRDLQLERARWEAEFELASRKEREAMAGNDRAVLRQMAAQAAQAQAQLDLAREKLARLEIRAPFDGVVVKGDLSQLLGAPVEAGKVLFELAPLQAWRVILKVDERDIAHVREGQAGELVLTGMPGASYAVSTRQVLSVAQAEEGRNHFRVEATLQGDTARLRPGMEGVAKVDVGQASALWLATHRLTDWLRRTVWEWTP